MGREHRGVARGDRRQGPEDRRPHVGVALGGEAVEQRLLGRAGGLADAAQRVGGRPPHVGVRVGDGLDQGRDGRGRPPAEPSQGLRGRRPILGLLGLQAVEAGDRGGGPRGGRADLGVLVGRGQAAQRRQGTGRVRPQLVEDRHDQPADHGVAAFQRGDELRLDLAPGVAEAGVGIRLLQGVPKRLQRLDADLRGGARQATAHRRDPAGLPSQVVPGPGPPDEAILDEGAGHVPLGDGVEPQLQVLLLVLGPRQDRVQGVFRGLQEMGFSGLLIAAGDPAQHGDGGGSAGGLGGLQHLSQLHDGGVHPVHLLVGRGRGLGDVHVQQVQIHADPLAHAVVGPQAGADERGGGPSVGQADAGELHPRFELDLGVGILDRGHEGRDRGRIFGPQQGHRLLADGRAGVLRRRLGQGRDGPLVASAIGVQRVDRRGPEVLGPVGGGRRPQAVDEGFSRDRERGDRPAPPREMAEAPDGLGRHGRVRGVEGGQQRRGRGRIDRDAQERGGATAHPRVGVATEDLHGLRGGRPRRRAERQEGFQGVRSDLRIGVVERGGQRRDRLVGIGRVAAEFLRGRPPLRRPGAREAGHPAVHRVVGPEDVAEHVAADPQRDAQDRQDDHTATRARPSHVAIALDCGRREPRRREGTPGGPRAARGATPRDRPVARHAVFGKGEDIENYPRPGGDGKALPIATRPPKLIHAVADAPGWACLRAFGLPRTNSYVQCMDINFQRTLADAPLGGISFQEFAGKIW
ncbi:hypothetical protein PZE19_26295 [Paludisphaera sp. Pla2]|uniref:Uncharacterized protein n=1 Tax=Paludisphaera mucosa TaxID=3030827 RepID=A0ABT6FIU3_9BACT|nr:hypothetical protein [Paludisphaera mucosa]MDG3007288.1 hypothetical protein [Paludisphaera mucosa]